MRRTALFSACCAALALAGAAVAQPANDSCNSPDPIAFGVQTGGTTVGTVDNPELQLSNTWCSTNPLDVWYTFDPDPSTAYRVELLNVVDADASSSNICISVMDACNGTDNPAGVGIGDADDGFPGNIIGFDFVSNASGDPVRIRVGSQGTGHTFDVLISTPPPAPANDLCANAILVPSLPFGDTVLNLERAGNDPDLTTCNSNDAPEMNNAVWWRFEGNDANIRVLFNDIEFSGTYAVFTGSNCNALSEVACASLGEQFIDFFAQAGSTYYFVIMHNAQLPIHDIGNDATIDVSFAPGGPANDACANPVPLTLGVDTPGSTVGATGSAIASCGSDTRDVWYSFTPTASTTYLIETLSFDNDVDISVFEGFCPFGVDLDYGCATTSALTNSLLYTSDCNASPVLVRIASAPNEEADFEVTITQVADAPANDRCCAAQPISLATPVSGTTVGASRSSSEVASCNTHNNDVWYVFTPPADGSYRVSVSDPATSRTSSITAFNGCPETGAPELNCRSANDPVMDFVAFSGVPVYLRVGSGSTATTTVDFQIRVDAEPVPTDCANARLITSIPFSDTWQNIETAFADSDRLSCNTSSAAFMTHAVWWRFVGDGSRLRVTMDDDGFTGAYGIFEGFDCFSASQIYCGTSGTDVVDIETSVGSTYFFVISNNSATNLTDTGNNALLDIQIAPPIPDNDECENATVLTEGVPAPGTTVAATGFDSDTCSGDQPRDVWYVFDPQPSTRYFITVANATGSGTLSIWNSCSDFVSQVCLSATNPQLDFTSNFSGDPFYIRFATSPTTEVTFNVVVEEAPAPPPNDDCSNATVVTPGVPVPGTTLGAGGTDVASCGADEWDVWYTLNAANGVRYRATARDVTGAVSIAAFAACEASEISCDTGSATSAAFTEFVGTGSPVWIRVASNTGETIDFDVIVEIATAPANDACSAPQPISTGADTPGTTFFATEDAGIPGTVCGSDEWDVWYTFTPAPSTVYQVRLTGFDQTPSLGLYNACNVASSQCDSSSPFILQFTSNASGDPVLFRVASDGSLQQETDFVIRVDPRAPAPANNSCVDAIDLDHGVPVHGTTAGATQDGSASCGGDEWDVWYTFTPLPNTEYRVRLSNITVAPSLSIFDACGGAELFCDTGDAQFPPSIDFTSDGLGSPVTFRVATDEATVEEAEFDIVVEFPPPPPANDECENAIAVMLNDVIETSTAGASGSDVSACGSAVLDVWFTFDPEPNTNYRVRVLSTTGTAFLGVFSSCGGAATEIDCDNGAAIAVPHVDFTSDGAGSPVLMRLASNAGQELDFTFTVTLAQVPGNDLCSNPTVVDLSSGPYLEVVDTASATDDGNTLSCASLSPNADNSVWYSITTTSTMELIATATPLGFNPDFVLYTGACGDLTEVICGDTGGTNVPDVIVWTAQAGVTYLLSTSDDGSLATGGLTDISIRSTCPCEYNGQSGVNVFDLLSYLDLWFAQAPGAEADGNPGINVFDLLEYLDCWFTASAGNPCP